MEQNNIETTEQTTEKQNAAKPIKKFMIILCSVIAAVIIFLLIIIIMPSRNKSAGPTTSEPVSSQFIDLEFIDEKIPVRKDKTTTPAVLNEENYNEFIGKLDSYSYGFTYADLFSIKEAYEIYKTVTYPYPTRKYSLLTDGKFDATKLFNAVIKNNEECMSNGKNSINTFYTETGDDDKKFICETICELFNYRAAEFDVNKMEAVLSNLKIFNHTGSTSLAAVNKDMVLTYNPTIIELTNKANNITTSKNTTTEDAAKSTLLHEAEHILQYIPNDLNNDNGTELGPFRNFADSKINILANTLYDPWILESAAEIRSCDYNNKEPMTYKKAISYSKSYTAVRTLEDLFKTDDFVLSAYAENIEAMFDKLQITDPDEQTEFLSFLYCVELCQFPGRHDDFLKMFSEKNSIEMTPENQLDIQLRSRSDAVKYMTKIYYNNLASAMKDGKIKDMETLFFFVRLWETDSLQHMQSTTASCYEYSKEYVLLQNDIQNDLFKAVAESTSIDFNDIRQMYDSYNVFVTDSTDKTLNNFDLSAFAGEKQQFYTDFFNSISSSGYTRNINIVNYIFENDREAHSEKQAK